MSQPAPSTIWQTIENVISTASGLGSGRAIWRYLSAPQPALDYVDLALGAMTTAGIDYVAETPVPDWIALTPYVVDDRVANDGSKTYVCTGAGISAGAGGPTGTGAAIVDGSVTWAFVSTDSGVVLTVGGVREVPLMLQAWSAAIVEQVAEATALSILDTIVTRLRLPAAATALAAVGVTAFDPGAVNWLPSIASTTFRGRATCDVRCRMPAQALAEYADFIASISGVATVRGAPTDPLSVPFSSQ